MCDKPGSVSDSCQSQELSAVHLDKQKQTDSKSLVWLSADQRVPESQITDGMISTLTVVCSACGLQLNHHKQHKIYLHKKLNVIVCKRCYDYYGDGEFDKDSSGSDEYCTWCAEGGKLMICDQCGRAFCKNCIRRNLSRREVSRILSLNVWLCYVCHPAQIVELVRYAEIITEYSKKIQQARHVTCPELLSVSIDDEQNVEEAVSDIAQQLRLVAERLESDLKKNSKTVMRRADSMLRQHLKNVSEVAKKVKTIQRERAMPCRQSGKATARKRRSLRSSSSDGDQDIHNVDNDTGSVSSVTSATRSRRRMHRLLSTDSLSLSLPLECEEQSEAIDKKKEDDKEETHNKDCESGMQGEAGGINEQTTISEVCCLPEEKAATCEGDKGQDGTEEEHEENGDLDCLKPLISDSQDESMPNTAIPESQDLFTDDSAGRDDKDEDLSQSLLHSLQGSQNSEATPGNESDSAVGENMGQASSQPQADKIEEKEQPLPGEAKEKELPKPDVVEGKEEQLQPDEVEEKKEQPQPDEVEENKAQSQPDDVEEKKQQSQPDEVEEKKQQSQPDEVEEKKQQSQPDEVEEKKQQSQPDEVEEKKQQSQPDEVEEKKQQSQPNEIEETKQQSQPDEVEEKKQQPQPDEIEEKKQQPQPDKVEEKEQLQPLEVEEKEPKKESKDNNLDTKEGESSSLSDNEERIVTAETESVESDSESNPPKTTKANQSPAKRSPRKRAPLSENEKARRALQRSLHQISSDSSSDDEAQDSKLKLSPRICKTTPQKRGRRPPLMESTPKANDAVGSLDDDLSVQKLDKEDWESIGYDTEDPKLKMKPVVIVERLQLFVGAAGKRKNKDSSEDEIERLLKMPGKVKSRSSRAGARGSEAEARVAAKRAKKAKFQSQGILDSDSESSSRSSDSEEQDSDNQTSKAPPKSNNELSKEALLHGILNSSNESDSENEEPICGEKKKTTKKTKGAPKHCAEDGEETTIVDDGDHANSDDPPNEEVIKKKSKKWKKYEKLLKTISIESGSEEEAKKMKGNAENSNSRKKASPKKRKLMFSDEEDVASGAKNTESEESTDDSSSFDSSEDSSRDFKSSTRKGARKGRGTRKNKRSESGSESEKPKKKRKRIKVASSSSANEDGNEVETLKLSQNSDNKGRKNIRKLLSDSDLTKKTKMAAQEEEERKKRIKERQKLYNEAMGSAADKSSTVVDNLILEIDTKTKTPIVSVNPVLVQCMKPHQTKGVKFMYDCTIETVEMLSKDNKGAGAILAHCMGLGKTFQVVSFLHTVLTNEHTKKFLRTALVVCPYNTILNWVEEFARWLEDRGMEIPVREISSIKDNATRVDVLKLWQAEGGVLILGYDMFRLLANGKGRRYPQRLRESIEEALLDPGPDIVICDEGHVLKNDSSHLSKAMCRVRTNRRIVLTGTPLQNNLQEYHCMVNFVKPNLLGTKKEFLNRFVNPIKNGQCADSTFLDVKLMKKRVHILHSLLDGCVQRCDYSALSRFLPPKHEYVISVKLSEQQVALYRHYLDNLARNKQSRIVGASMLYDYNALRNIWTHPYLLQIWAERMAMKELDNEEDDFINDDSSSGEAKNDEDDDVVCLDDPKPSSSKKEKKKSGGESSEDEVVRSWHTRSRGTVDDDAESKQMREEQERRTREKQWWSQYVPEEDMEKYEISGKMLLLSHILQECDSIGDKVLLFSQSLATLDMVEQMLQQFEERAEAAAADATALISVNDALRDCQNTWSLGVDYFRMDGSTAADLRKRWIEIFNDEENQRARLFLISTRAGSLGTNLVGANRVILMDASWNPTHDVQSIFRVYRFGQKKPVFIYRLLAHGTMEEKIYDRQVTKQSLSCRVIDEQQIERHFNAADLQELYIFNPESKSNRPTPMVPKDRLLAELLIRHKEWILSYHEHDSLLQNISEEDLTEEERKIAWEEYNAEREGRFRMNTENVGANAYQQTPPNPAGGVPKMFALDLNKIIHDIRAKNPNITSEQLAINLRDALTAYRQEFRKQQMAAFNQRTAYQREKQLVPQDVINRLSQSSMAIQQLNTLLTQLEASISNARANATAYQHTRMPNVMRNMNGAQRYNAAQQFSHMQRTGRLGPRMSAWVQANARFRQPCNTTFHPSTTAPIICEADDGTPAPERPAQRPSTSSVTITEIID